MIGILFSVVCFLLFWIWRRKLKMYETLNLPPMYPGLLPFIGHAHIMIGNTTRLSLLFNFVKDTGKKYLSQSVRFKFDISTELWTKVKELSNVCLKHGGVICGFIGSDLYYVIADPEDSLTAANSCLQKHFAYDFGKPWMGEGLVLSSGATWKRHRKLLNPAFSLQVLHSFLGIFNSQARKLIEQMTVKVGGGPFNHLVMLKDIALETVCLTAFGITAEEDKEFNQAYMKAVDQILNIIALRFQNIWLHSNLIYRFSELKKREDTLIRVLNNMSEIVIKRKKATLKLKQNKNSEHAVTSGLKCKAFMDLLLELSQDNALSDKEIREEVDTIIAAAFDTTSCLLTYILMLLGTYPEKQEKVVKEIKEVFGGGDLDVEKDDLPKLVYTEAVIKETLRLYPTGPVGLRYVDRDVKLKNYTMHRGSQCVILNYGIHHHPMWGADVQQFNPDRWLTPDSLPPGPNIFAGFSIGKRSCMGRTFAMISMKITLVHILRRYRITSDINKLVLKIDFLLKPVSGHDITIADRNL